MNVVQTLIYVVMIFFQEKSSGLFRLKPTLLRLTLGFFKFNSFPSYVKRRVQSNMEKQTCKGREHFVQVRVLSSKCQS